jgi:hypothetical protein
MGGHHLGRRRVGVGPRPGAQRPGGAGAVRPQIAGLDGREDWYFVGRRREQRRWPADLIGPGLSRPQPTTVTATRPAGRPGQRGFPAVISAGLPQSQQRAAAGLAQVVGESFRVVWRIGRRSGVNCGVTLERWPEVRAQVCREFGAVPCYGPEPFVEQGPGLNADALGVNARRGRAARHQGCHQAPLTGRQFAARCRPGLPSARLSGPIGVASAFVGFRSPGMRSRGRISVRGRHGPPPGWRRSRRPVRRRMGRRHRVPA